MARAPDEHDGVDAGYGRLCTSCLINRINTLFPDANLETQPSCNDPHCDGPASDDAVERASPKLTVKELPEHIF